MSQEQLEIDRDVVAAVAPTRSGRPGLTGPTGVRPS